MSFNLFGSASQDDIRVGYIHPSLGYVDGVSVCEANDYAKDNPGTTFVFRDGDNNIRYLNINEVNSLTPNDLIAKNDECAGIQEYRECGPPIIQFFGGGGIGAVGNPVIGRDGSLLAVDIVSGGHGYQYPPIVAAKDNCEIGNGAVLTAILGETVDEIEVFEGEDDFEDYEICEDTDVGYGVRYGPNGEVLGPWEPQTYTRVGADPIQREIEIFQRALKKPFWTTREKQPDRVATFEKFYATQDTTAVTFPDWGEFMNQYAVSPVKPSNVPGSDESGKVFSMEWELNFPISGEYIFRGVCDNVAQLYIDDGIVGDLKGFKDNPSPLQKTVQEGNHIVRVDLLNVPVTEKVTLPVSVASGTVDVTFTIIGNGKNTDKMKFSFVSGDYSFTLKGNPKSGQSRKETIKLNPNTKFKVLASSTKSGGVEQGIIKNGTKNKEGGTGDSNRIFADHIQSDNDNDDIQIVTNIGSFKATNKRKTPDGRSTFDLFFEVGKIPTSTNTTTSPTIARKKEEVTFSINEAGSDESSIEIVDLLIASKDEDIFRKVEIGKVYQVIAKPNNRKLKTDGKVLRLEDSTDNDFNDLVIKATKGKFYDVNKNRCKFILESTTTTTTAPNIGEIISPKSWYENPMGVSMIIDAPLPPVPQEQPPVQIGRCPPNPIWTTRFPGSNQTWYPVRFRTWSKFTNRYAISPVLPLDTPGSDSSGINFTNTWQVDLPYAGYYGVKGTCDNTGRILIDGKEVYNLAGWTVNNPKISKVYLTKGRHSITVEVANTLVEQTSVIDTKIFSTGDWRSPSTQESSSSKLKPKFIQQGSSFYLQVDGSGSGEIAFTMDVDDNPFTAGMAAQEVIIPSDGGGVRLKRDPTKQKDNNKGSGKFTGGKKYGPIQIIGAGPGARGPILTGKNTLGLRDADGDDQNIKVTIGNVKESSTSAPKTSQSPVKNGVSYSGPPLFGYIEKRWSKYMNEFSVSPKVTENVGKFVLTWAGVDFPYAGTYKFNFQADNNAVLKVGGREIFKTSDFIGEKIQYTFNATPGKYDIVIELENIKTEKGGKNDFKFESNPMGVALFISKDVTFIDSNKKSWTTNPMGASAILIPPPCAKKIGGKGVVDKVIIADPGNGYLPPPEKGPGYPVTLVLDEVIVENPGINYRCGEDQIQITPNNGAQLSYDCDSFGRIRSVQVLNPGIGFNVYPEIKMVSSLPSNIASNIPSNLSSVVPANIPQDIPTNVPQDIPTDVSIDSLTGINASFRPVFRVVRDPIQFLEDQKVKQEALIQVTDLVGLKQTGYVDGRAYYGAIYYDKGIPYAGYYKTTGPQTRVYATLQESITARVTTPPSAIQRSGTDVRSNDPRLNIPGTPESTSEL